MRWIVWHSRSWFRVVLVLACSHVRALFSDLFYLSWHDSECLVFFERIFSLILFFFFVSLSVCPTRTLSHTHLHTLSLSLPPLCWLSAPLVLSDIHLSTFSSPVHHLPPCTNPTSPCPFPSHLSNSSDLYYHCLEFCRLMPDHMIVYWPRQLHVWWQSNHPRWHRFLSCLLLRHVSQCQLFMYYVWRQLALSCQPLLHLRLFWARLFTGRTRSLSCWIFFCWALYISLSNERHIMVFLLPSFCHVSYPTQVHVSHSLFCQISFSSFLSILPWLFFFASCCFATLCFSFYCCFISVLHVRKRFLFFPFLRWLTSFPALQRLFVFFFSPYVTLVFDAWLSSSAPLSLSA